MLRARFQQILEAALQKTAVVWPLAFHLTNHRNTTNKVWLALPGKEGRIQKRFSPVGCNTWLQPVLAYLQRLTSALSRTLNADQKTYKKRRLIGVDVEEKGKGSVQHTLMIIIIMMFCSGIIQRTRAVSTT